MQELYLSCVDCALKILLTLINIDDKYIDTKINLKLGFRYLFSKGFY